MRKVGWTLWPIFSPPGGVEPTPALAQYRALCRGIPGKTVMGAALACTDETDFRRRIGDRRGLHPAHSPHPDAGE